MLTSAMSFHRGNSLSWACKADVCASTRGHTEGQRVKMNEAIHTLPSSCSEVNG
ncbi:MAG: hypothetical protein WD768_08280 [Phycisphaeraceae bacterium]